MKFSYLCEQSCDISQFVEFWSACYTSENEDQYSQNISRELTSETIYQLFEWKNGGRRLTEKKKKSVVDKINLLNSLQNNISLNDFFEKLGKGGTIWNIFFLHILLPTQYPIFDQHVYRAMVFIKTRKIEEIPNNDKAKQQKYITEYIPFYRDLGAFPDRKLDKALWAFGKFLKSPFGKMIG